MAENEDKTTTIDYSPEEQEEISRIIQQAEERSHVQYLDVSPPEDTISFVEPEASEEEDSPGDDEYSFDESAIDDHDILEEAPSADERFGDIPDDLVESEPDNLDLPQGDFTLDDFDDDISTGDTGFTDIDLSDEPDLSQVKQEGLDDITAVEDITDLITDVDDEDELPDITDSISDVPGTDDVREDLPIVDDLEPEDSGDSPSLDDFDTLDDIEPFDTGEISDDFSDETTDALPPLDNDFSDDGFDTVPDLDDFTSDQPEAVSDDSPLGQLNDLVADEPDSLDSQDMVDDLFGDDEVLGDIPAMDDGDIDGQDDISSESNNDIQLDSEDVEDVPNLSELDVEDASSFDEAVDDDIPDLDLDDLGGGADLSADEPMTLDGLDGLDGLEDDLSDDIFSDAQSSMDGADNFGTVDDLPGDTGGMDDLELDLSLDGDTSSSSDEMPAFDSGDDFSIEPLDDDTADVSAGYDEPEHLSGADAVELSQGELKKLKKAILLFSPGLISAIKDTVINDLLPGRETRQLVDMILSGKQENTIQRFLEKKLETSIDTSYSNQVASKVIHQRPEYTREGMQRQKKLLKFTGILGASVLAAIVVTILSFQYIYKPVMAKKLIKEGVAKILSPKKNERETNYLKAEKLFRKVDENYQKDYIYGYTEYGKAYLANKDYRLSLKKLNKAYTIDPLDSDVLNNLGRFYSRISPRYYRQVSENIHGWYYIDPRKEKPVKRITDKKQLDVAIDMYKRVLVRDKDNAQALVGIGDAYFRQKRYLEAKQYYESLIASDSTSVPGYAGLMNLYLERDAFPQVAETHAKLRYKKMLHELPSPLLGKMAMYYLDKRSTDKGNVRVDYGVISPRVIDKDDNTYPAVRNILAAITKRDSKYPPLQVYSARLAYAQKNMPVMKRYLDKALKLDDKYFAAHHLLGKYYYKSGQPDKAYQHLAKAVKYYGYQPDFTRADFYRETESISETHHLIGNIFYYYFDSGKERFGDLDNDSSRNTEALENLDIARKHYETASTSKYSSPEVHYNLGRIYYKNREYGRALQQWLNLYDDFVTTPELMLALGNAFYHVNKFDASRGEYLKLISFYEKEAEKIQTVYPDRPKHVTLYTTLSSAYNNLGAVYQNRQDEARSHISYWKSVELAKQVERENEFARVNLGRSFKMGREVEPILDEKIPYVIKRYRDN